MGRKVVLVLCLAVSGCATHKNPPLPQVPPVLYCYPVDEASGQQMCVKQLFNPYEWARN